MIGAVFVTLTFISAGSRRLDDDSHAIEKENGRAQKRASRATLLTNGGFSYESQRSDSKAFSKCSEDDLVRRVLDTDRPDDQFYESVHRLQRMRRRQAKKDSDQQMLDAGFNCSDTALSDDSSSLSSGAEDIASVQFSVSQLRQQLLKLGYDWHFLRKQSPDQLQSLKTQEDDTKERKEALELVWTKVDAALQVDAQDPEHRV